MYGKLFLYTPRSGSKIIASSQCPMAPRWAVETLTNNSHIIHYTAPLYRVPPSTRTHRADVGAILRHVARNADRDTSPRSLLAWDDRALISFIADERSILDIEDIARKFARGEGLIQAIEHKREEEAIFGDGGADTRLFSSPAGSEILHVTNGYTISHPAHKDRATVEAERATFSDIDINTALVLSRQLLQILWDGMSAPVPTETEAVAISSAFADWMDWCDDEPHAAEMKAMLLEPIGPELQDWANEFFSKHHRLSLGFYPARPAHWVSEEDEIPEPTPEPIAEIAPEPTPEEVAAQKKNEAFAEVWREHLRGSIGHWMASNLNHPYPRLDSDADVAEAHAAICRRVAAVWSGWSDMWWRSPSIYWRSPSIYSRATEGDGLYPEILPLLPRREEGDSPSDAVWVEWLKQLSPSQMLAFLLYTQEVEGIETDWNIPTFNTNAPDSWKKTINALSHAFPFPFPHVGLEPHPTKKERWVLKDWHAFYLNRRHLPLSRWDVLRRHFSSLVKMAEHAPE